MITNELRDYVYEIMGSKGFHDKPIEQTEALVWRQLMHALIEANECAEENDTTWVAEELADVGIVLLDLAGILRLSIPEKVKLDDEPFWTAMCHAANHYRKHKVLDFDRIWTAYLGMAHDYEPHLGLEIAIRKKMAKNEGRPPLYGLAE